jgi:hypothetical protein
VRFDSQQTGMKISLPPSIWPETNDDYLPQMVPGRRTPGLMSATGAPKSLCGRLCTAGGKLGLNSRLKGSTPGLSSPRSMRHRFGRPFSHTQQGKSTIPRIAQPTAKTINVLCTSRRTSYPPEHPVGLAGPVRKDHIPKPCFSGEYRFSGMTNQALNRGLPAEGNWRHGRVFVG